MRHTCSFVSPLAVLIRGQVTTNCIKVYRHTHASNAPIIFSILQCPLGESQRRVRLNYRRDQVHRQLLRSDHVLWVSRLSFGTHLDSVL